MGFDGLVMELLGQSLENLKAHLVKHEVTNQYLQPDSLITTVRQIRRNSSLRPYYEAMYNQCLVLTVSHFASAVRDLFVEGLGEAVQTLNTRVTDEDIRLKVEDIMDVDVERHILVAETIADRGDYSWQDMQSIGRAFAKYFGEAPERDSVVNDIIVAQAIRHSVVHAGSKADRRLIGQVKKAMPRSLAPKLVRDQHIQLAPEDVRLAGQSMLTYLERLDGIVRAAAI